MTTTKIHNVEGNISDKWSHDLASNKPSIKHDPTTSTLLRGSISGSIAKTLVYPLDRLKMMRQIKLPLNNIAFRRNALMELAHIIRREGFFSLWKGNTAALGRTFPHSGIVFYCFDLYHSLFIYHLPNHSVLCHFLSGSLSGASSTILTYPLDIWNTRMAIARAKFRYSEITLLSFHGTKSLTCGLLPTLLGILPYAGVSFCVYNTLKEKRLSIRPRKEGYDTTLTTSEALICGGIAGFSSQTVVYPIDTIRKTLQANAFLNYYKCSEHSGLRLNPLLKEVIQMIHQRKGLRGFYDGLLLNIIKGFLAAGIAFSLNEKLKSLEHSKNCTA